MSSSKLPFFEIFFQRFISFVIHKVEFNCIAAVGTLFGLLCLLQNKNRKILNNFFLAAVAVTIKFYLICVKKIYNEILTAFGVMIT